MSWPGNRGKKKGAVLTTDKFERSKLCSWKNFILRNNFANVLVWNK